MTAPVGTPTEPEISQEAARAMLAAFQPREVVSAWPDAGWPDEDEELDPTESWIVGIAYRRPFDDTTAYAVGMDATPYAYTQLATVPGEQKARALAAFLNALAEGRAS